MKTVKVTQSIETLVHFQCGACHKWWSIGDAPIRSSWFCPWCGCKQVANQKPQSIKQKAR